MSLVQKMIAAAKLDVNLYESVEADSNATTEAMTVVIISAVAAGIGALGSAGGFLGMIMAVIASLLGWVVWAFLSYFIGTKILPEPQTDADLGQLMRTIGFAQSPGVFRVLGIIPFLGWLINLAVGIWMLVATVIAIRQALDYQSTGRAVAVAAIGWVVFMLISFVLAMVVGIGAVGMGAMGMGQ